MSYDFILDFNNVDTTTPTRTLMPAGTCVKVTLTIKPGGYGPGGWFTQNASTGSVYLNTVFTVMGGQYDKSKIFHCIGIPKTAEKSNKDTWGQMGHALLRSLWESAHRINPKESTDQAKAARKMQDLSQLDGLVCAVEVGQLDDKSGRYPRKNTVEKAITIDHKNYNEIMGMGSPQAYSQSATAQWQYGRGVL